MSIIEMIINLISVEVPEEPEEKPVTVKAEETVMEEHAAENEDRCHVNLYTPVTFEDSGKIAEFLREDGSAAVVSIMRMEAGEAQKMLDFLQGAVFMIHGGIERLNSHTWLCTNNADMIQKNPLLMH